MNSRCINCKHYLPVNDTTGQCHLNPPVFAIMLDNTRKWLWPGVAVDHWCGQYAAKEVTEISKPTEVSIEGTKKEQQGVQTSEESPQPESE